MKKLGTLLLTEVVFGRTILTGMMPVNASSQNKDSKETTECACVFEDGQKEKSFIDCIKSSKNITEAEKQQLLKTEAELAPTWKKIDDLEAQVDIIYEKIMNPIYEKYDKIYGSNEKLWEKFYEGIDDEAMSEDTIAEIEKAKNLTAGEKATLKAEQEKINTLDSEWDKLSEKAEAETKELSVELDKLYSVVEKANEKNQKILDKLFPEITPIDEEFNR
ncbi:hypothetical protein [Peptoniphilus indolicus]|uniref:Uncharacterized protein n=2 Tax=Peptoniphilus indolicus TaxID=33030 RepID=G4D3H2_9FIRM|nr:hypothetical protein [Peptoniphilus indolicus]EGY79938.1 hypothetical protein HMPREF9129_0952 [Peptoniphilus indolicus ATCC 29427]SUB75641.1 Uncharacterised protein [Peptoniphilus indolicus]